MIPASCRNPRVLVRLVLYTRNDYPEAREEVTHDEEDETEEEEALEAKADFQELRHIREDARLVFKNLEHAKQSCQLHKLAQLSNFRDTQHVSETADVENDVDGKD